MCVLVLLATPIYYVYAGSTGKLAGQIVDLETSEPLAGVNVILDGTPYGTASDMNGYYVILNIPPSSYNVMYSMIGYTKKSYENIRIHTDQTTRLEIELSSTVIEFGREVTVIGERSLVRKDLTSTVSIVGSDELLYMPVEEFAEVLELQTGVVRGATGELHIRGGRSNEIGYLVDGLSITDPYSGTPAVEVENQMIQEIQLISGTFNAEYGQVMSGIVDIVSKEGGKQLGGTVSAYWSDYYTNKTVLLNNHKTKFFQGLNNIDLSTNQNLQLSLHGPLLTDKITFFLSSRHMRTTGWLMGLRRFMPKDSSSFQEVNPEDWYIENTGDSSYVSLNGSEKLSVQGRLTFQLTPTIKFSYNGLWSDVSYQDRWDDELERDIYHEWVHLYQLNPSGNVQQIQKGYTNLFQWNHTLSPSTFYTLKFSTMNMEYSHYVFDDPFDSRYVHPDRLRDAQQYGFYTGGTNMEHFSRATRFSTFKFDITSQINRLNQLKTGLELRKYLLTMDQIEIVPKLAYGEGQGGFEEIKPFEPDIPPLTSIKHNQYEYRPQDYSVYIQDKVELDEVIFNIGLRYDFFNPDAIMPTDLRDPSNNKYYIVDNGVHQIRVDALEYNGEGSVIDTVDVLGKSWNYKYKEVPSVNQFSPRLGFSFPITDKGILHFSHGYFFQVPSFQYLYINPDFELAVEDISTLMGNAGLKPQQTIIYEVGFQQQFGTVIGVDVTGFYKDIRNLLGVEIQKLYTGLRYARYANVDYGNVRGFTVNFKKIPSRGIAATASYTFQIAEGNASDPKAAFEDATAIPPLESEIQVVALDWDQRHTLNASTTIVLESGWSISLIGQVGSGLPYTPALRNVRTKFENSERMRMTYNFDLRGDRTFNFGPVQFSLFVKIYNLFDTLNELTVYSDTGRAGYTLQKLYAYSVQGVNTVDEYFHRPDWFSEPRKIMIGLSVKF